MNLDRIKDRNVPVGERETPARERERSIDPRQLSTLKEVGQFRVVTTADLAHYHYAGNAQAMRADLANLSRAGSALVELRTFQDRKSGQQIEVAVLTKAGKAELASRDARELQPIYSGFTRTREMAHDSKIYPAYQAAKQDIEARGGTVTRMVLDSELKGIKAQLTNQKNDRGEVNSKLSLTEKEAIAKAMQLKVSTVRRGGEIQQVILLPDIRVQYKDREGKDHIHDVEVVSSTYRDASRKAKAAAGFALSTGNGSAPRAGAAVRSERLWD